MAASARRAVGALLLALIGGSVLSGCLIGPDENLEHRLVLSDWKRKRQRPILLDPDFVYRGEYMVEAIEPDRTAEAGPAAE